MNNGFMAGKILELNKKWEELSKHELVDYIEDHLFERYPDCRSSFDIKLQTLSDITASKYQTVYAWLNRSRDNVKIPFLKLCMFASALDLSLEDFLGVSLHQEE